jgi:hypothetical protein
MYVERLHRFHCRHRCKLAPRRMMHNFESDMPEMVKSVCRTLTERCYRLTFGSSGLCVTGRGDLLVQSTERYAAEVFDTPQT